MHYWRRRLFSLGWKNIGTNVNSVWLYLIRETATDQDGHLLRKHFLPVLCGWFSRRTNQPHNVQHIIKRCGAAASKKKKSGRAEKEAKSRRQTEETIVRARSRGLACSETHPNLMTPLWHQNQSLCCWELFTQLNITVDYSWQSRWYHSPPLIQTQGDSCQTKCNFHKDSFLSDQSRSAKQK